MRWIKAFQNRDILDINVDNISSIFYADENHIFVKMNNGDNVTIDILTYERLLKNRWCLMD